MQTLTSSTRQAPVIFDELEHERRIQEVCAAGRRIISPAIEVTVGSVVIAGLRYGQIVSYPDGFRFIPAMDSHKPSRKAWNTPSECLPRWLKAIILRDGAA